MRFFRLCAIILIWLLAIGSVFFINDARADITKAYFTGWYCCGFYEEGNPPGYPDDPFEGLVESGAPMWGHFQFDDDIVSIDDGVIYVSDGQLTMSVRGIEQTYSEEFAFLYFYPSDDISLYGDGWFNDYIQLDEPAGNLSLNIGIQVSEGRLLMDFDTFNGGYINWLTMIPGAYGSPHGYWYWSPFFDIATLSDKPVPEPATILLLSTGLLGIAGWGRKKFRKH